MPLCCHWLTHYFLHAFVETNTSLALARASMSNIKTRELYAKSQHWGIKEGHEEDLVPKREEEEGG